MIPTGLPETIAATALLVLALGAIYLGRTWISLMGEIARQEPSGEADADESDCDLWFTGPVACEVCGHEWIATYPDGCHDLECPHCHQMTTAPHLDD